LEQQIAFIREIDRLKGVVRQSVLLDRSRRENSAEHSWHLAVMALLLGEYAAEPIDLDHVVRLLLVHDIVEVDAGDTYAYDTAGARDKAEREARAADRLFSLAPADQGAALRALWEEFEAAATAEARFANALDRLQPLLHNALTGGASWRAHGIRRSQVLARQAPVADAAPALWAYAQHLVAAAVARGELLDDGAADRRGRYSDG
jgi:putative hydrolase of HD superfamily